MLSNRLRSSLASVILIATALSVPVIAQKADKESRKPAKLDKALTTVVENDDKGEQRVIIRLVPGASLALADTLRANGRKVNHVHPSINAIAATIPAADLDMLASLPSVASISTDAVVTAEQTATVAPYTLRMTMGLALQSPGGNRVGVAVIDSGLEPSSEFDSRILGFYDFTAGGVAAPPSRRLRPWHARRRAHRRQR